GNRVAYVGQILELLSDHALPWVSVDYRLGGGTREQDALADVAAAVAFIREHAAAMEIDADRLVLIGEDTGAQIAIALLQRRPQGVVGTLSVGSKLEASALSVR